MILPLNLRGIACMLLAMGIFVASDTCFKLAMQGMPMFELIVIRGIAGVLVCLVVAAAMGDGGKLPQVFDKWVLARTGMEIFANFCFTLAIFHMPIADVTSIVLVAPLLTLIGARILWHEHLGARRIVLIALGLSGAMLVAQPGATAASPYAMLGFLIAMAVSVRDLLSRKVGPEIPASVVALAIMLAMIVAGAICMALFETAVVPDLRNIGLAAIAAALMVAGQMSAFMAFKFGPVRSVAPFMYSITVWAGLLGFLVFGDVPNSLALWGMALVVVAGLSIILLDGHKTSEA